MPVPVLLGPLSSYSSEFAMIACRPPNSHSGPHESRSLDLATEDTEVAERHPSSSISVSSVFSVAMLRFPWPSRPWRLFLSLPVYYYITAGNGSRDFPMDLTNVIRNPHWKSLADWPASGERTEEKGTGTFCAKHPKRRSGKRCLSPSRTRESIRRRGVPGVRCGRPVSVGPATPR